MSGKGISPISVEIIARHGKKKCLHIKVAVPALVVLYLISTVINWFE